MRDIPITNPNPPAADAGPRAHAPSKEEEQEEQELTGSHAEGKARRPSFRQKTEYSLTEGEKWQENTRWG